MYFWPIPISHKQKDEVTAKQGCNGRTSRKSVISVVKIMKLTTVQARKRTLVSYGAEPQECEKLYEIAPTSSLERRLSTKKCGATENAFSQVAAITSRAAVKD